jgi:hypothetical protein
MYIVCNGGTVVSLDSISAKLHSPPTQRVSNVEDAALKECSSLMCSYSGETVL